MVIAFFAVSFVLAVALVIGIVAINKIEHEMTRLIQVLFGVATIAILLNGLGVLASSEALATMLHGLYLAATDWLIVVLMQYVKRYIDDPVDRPVARYTIYVVAAFDTISMFVNTFTHHVFSQEWVPYKNMYCYEMVPDYTYYKFHLMFVYGLALLVIISLAKKSLTTPKTYRNKYEIVLVSFFIILFANVGYRFVDSPIDFSSIFYSFLAIATGYFTLFFVPKGVVVKLLGFSLKDLNNGIACYDKDGKNIYANKVAVKFYEISNSNADVKKGLEDRLVYFLKGKTAEEKEDCTFQYTAETENGTVHVETTFRKLYDEDGNYMGCYLETDDRTEEEERLEKEHYRATHDSLTNTLNREGFFEAVRKRINDCPGKDWYMICSDIKDFKLVNDLFGVKRGDEILIGLADKVKKYASEQTVFGRIASDRFAVFILRDLYNEELFIKCLSEVEDMATNSVFRMHIHMGVYRVSNTDMEIPVMCDRALLAISRIKDDYEQMVSYYDEELGNSLHEGNFMIGEFDKAIDENQFHIYLQPQFSVSRKLLGAEALVRWVHPEKGLIPPFKFIPLFERSGQIYKLDRCVWEQACMKLKEWKKQGREDLHISVNISPKDFYYIDIYETFTSLVEKYEISPENLKLEITETALMTDLQQQLGLLQRLREYGFSVEVDDFGSGYSSLNTLKDIEVDVLKIDMGFLGETEHKERSRTILNAVISMSKQLGLTIVTEGVETERQVDYLTDVGCDVFQGYYFAKPMPVNEFEDKYL